MPVEMCEYYARNNFNPKRYPEFHKDSLTRYAVSGIDTEIFRILAENFFNTETYSIKDVMTAAIILFKKGKYEMLDILTEGLEKADPSRNTPFSREARFEKIDSAIVLYGLFDGEKPDVRYEPYFYDSFYFDMITGDIEKAKETIRLKDDFNNYVYNYMLSAVLFRDTEILRFMFENGEWLTPGIVSDICEDPESIKYLCENFPEHIFIDNYKFDYDGWENSPMTAVEFVQHTVPPDQMLVFAHCCSLYMEQEHFNRLFENMPKILIVKEHYMPLYSGMMFNIRSGWINVFHDTPVCIVESGSSILNFTFAGDFVYDFSYTDARRFNSWGIPVVRKFLTEQKVKFDPVRLTPMLEGILDLNDGAVTGILIAKKCINNWNVNEVENYLAEHGLDNALNTVRGSEIPQLDLPF